VRILVIGSGGREHALCWKLGQSPDAQIFAAPGNPGIAQLGTCLPTNDYLAVATSIQPDLTVVGPEVPLTGGIVDQFRAHGFTILGPTAGAAQLEGSKAFAKAVMDQANIPTARYNISDNPEHARQTLSNFGLPVVLKADGLAAGKGVIVAHTKEQAESALVPLFELSAQIVIEEHLQGQEVSFIVLTDGRHVIPFEPTQDHKATHDNDEGPNTGGMGAYSDQRILTASEREQVLDLVIYPTLEYMRQHRHPFQGFLYAGLMMTDSGPKVLEFNARLGDPETQPLMLRLSSDLAPALLAAAEGRLSGPDLEWSPDPAVCVVAAASGYPGPARIGDPITGLDRVGSSIVFQAGTRLDEDGILRTNGGRVLGVTATAATLPEAVSAAYRDLTEIHFEGMHFRHDIGGKGLRRW
jgi:phosphoribosylamine--glycine ligase